MHILLPELQHGNPTGRTSVLSRAAESYEDIYEGLPVTRGKTWRQVRSDETKQDHEKRLALKDRIPSASNESGFHPPQGNDRRSKSVEFLMDVLTDQENSAHHGGDGSENRIHASSGRGENLNSNSDASTPGLVDRLSGTLGRLTRGLTAHRKTGEEKMDSVVVGGGGDCS